MSGQTIFDVLLFIFGGGGVIGVVTTFYKLRPDVNSQSVVQAQGAADALQTLAAGLERERDYWQRRSEACDVQLAKLRQMLDELEAEKDNWSHMG